MNQILRQWMESSGFPWSRLWKRTGRKASIVQQAKYPHLEWIDLLHSDAWARWTETPLSSCLSPLIILQDYEVVLFYIYIRPQLVLLCSRCRSETFVFPFTCTSSAWPLELSGAFSCCSAWRSCCCAGPRLRVSVCLQGGWGDWREDGAFGGRYDPWLCICYL